MIIQRSRFMDDRGFLSRLFCRNEFGEVGFADPVEQINLTLTRQRGAIRGLHFQHVPHAEDKLVMCLAGAIFDVAIDLRAGSPTFLKWHGEELSAENQRALLIPKGFAHGFQALTPDCELLYLHTAAYERSAEGALNAFDPKLAVAWPLTPTEMSERDRAHPFIDETFTGISL